MDQDYIISLERGWKQIKVPLPFSLKWVNSYLVPEENGYTLIDPGLRTTESVEKWEEVLELLHIRYTDIQKIIVTHQHPDHYGLAGFFQKKSGAPVYMSKASHHYTQMLWRDEEPLYHKKMSAFLLAHGMSQQYVTSILRNMSEVRERVSPHPKVNYIEAGQFFELGGVQWELIDAPGHAYGQLILYQKEWKWMICGDQVLPRITPNVGSMPEGEPYPLYDFMNALTSLTNYQVEFALPGHRDPFHHFQERIRQILDHHERRFDAILQYIHDEQHGIHAFQLCEQLFGMMIKNNPHNLRFAMTETIAHLDELVRRKHLDLDAVDGIHIYKLEN